MLPKNPAYVGPTCTSKVKSVQKYILSSHYSLPKWKLSKLSLILVIPIYQLEMLGPEISQS